MFREHASFLGSTFIHCQHQFDLIQAYSQQTHLSFQMWQIVLSQLKCLPVNHRTIQANTNYLKDISLSIFGKRLILQQCTFKVKVQYVYGQIEAGSYIISHITFHSRNHEVKRSLTWVNLGVLSASHPPLCAWLRLLGSAWQQPKRSKPQLPCFAEHQSLCRCGLPMVQTSPWF